MAISFRNPVTPESLKTNSGTGARKPPVEGMSCKQFVQALGNAGATLDQVGTALLSVWNGSGHKLRWSNKGEESTSETISRGTVKMWYRNGVKGVRDNQTPQSDSYLKRVSGKLQLPAKIEAIVGKVLAGDLVQAKTTK